MHTTNPHKILIVRSSVIKSSLVIRGPKAQVDWVLLRLEQGLGYHPEQLAETRVADERSVQLRLSSGDWARMPSLNITQEPLLCAGQN